MPRAAIVRLAKAVSIANEADSDAIAIVVEGAGRTVTADLVASADLIVNVRRIVTAVPIGARIVIAGRAVITTPIAKVAGRSGLIAKVLRLKNALTAARRLSQLRSQK